MATRRFHPQTAFSASKPFAERSKSVDVLLLCIALTLLPASTVFGQSTLQQEQQREQQQRDQQQRDQQQRDQQQREQEEHQRELSRGASHVSNASPVRGTNESGATSPGVQSSEPDNRHAIPITKAPQVPGKATSSVPVAKTAAKDHESSPSNSEQDRKLCGNGPCKEPEPKPVTSDLHSKICKDGPCPACPAGQARSKDGSCVVTATKGTAKPPVSKAAAATQVCPAGKIWNGLQCVLAGTQQQCLPGQTLVGAACQVDCTSPTASAENLIMELRSARQKKDEACRQ